MRGARIFIAAAVVLTVMAAAVALAPRTDASDTDLFWHLASGRIIVEQHGLPARDPFSYTSDQPWLDAEWLYDIAIYSVYQAGGYSGLALLRIGVVLLNAALAAALVWRRLPRDTPGSAVLAWLCAAFMICVCQSYLLMRPHLLGYTAMLVFLLIYFEALDGRLSTRSLVVSMGLLMVVWVNFHASFIIGLGILGGTAVMERRVPLLAALGAALLACCITPYGPRAAMHPLYYLHENVFARSISEMQAPSLASDHWPWFQLLLVGVAAVAVHLVRTRAWAHLVLLAGLTWQAVHHDRHIALLTIFWLPLAGRALAPAVRTTARRAVPVAVAVLALGVACGVAMGPVMRLLPLERAFRWEDYPIDADAFIADNHLPDALFNPFEWGGWLEWSMPGRRLFIDGRNEVAYSPETYLDYLRILQDSASRFALLERFGVRTVLVNRRFEHLGLAAALAASPDWTRVYDDDIALVFVRREAALLDRLSRHPVLPSSPYTEARRGLELLERGDAAAAQGPLEHALALDPMLVSARVNLGVAYMRLGRPADAVAQWEMATRDDPGQFNVHYLLGTYARLHGDNGRARREMEAELRLRPDFEPAQKVLRELP